MAHGGGFTLIPVPTTRLGRSPRAPSQGRTNTVTTAAPQQQAPEKKKKKFEFPSAFTILFFLTVIAVLCTWWVSAGSYSKVEYNEGASDLVVTAPSGETSDMPATQETLDQLGVPINIDSFTGGDITKPVSIPGTYEHVDPHHAGFMDIPLSMVHGTIEGVDIIVFILVLGGLIGVVRATGAFESGLFALTKKTKGREFILVAAVSILMVMGGSFCGLEEEAVAFYPILAPIFISLGFDAIVVVGSVFLAGSIGSAFSTINPFSVIIASNSAGIKFTEGIGWRAAGAVVGAIVVITYLYWYAKKIKKDPSASIAYEDREKFNAQWQLDTAEEDIRSFDLKQKVILILFAAAFPIMVWGVMSQGWWFPTMAASFLIITIIIMILSLFGKHKLSEGEVVEAFSQGASEMVGVALIIGLARGINLVLNEGMISDTMLDAATRLVSGMHGPVFILMLMVVFFFLGFVVPSSSGLAVLAMPIIAPLADSVGIPRFIAVSAYNWGQYAMLFIAPTGLVMATLQMLHIKYSHWLKFVWPMVVFMFVFGGAMLVAQVLIYS